MKKLLAIVVLGLLVCNIGLAKPKAEKFKYQSYNVSGFGKLFSAQYRNEQPVSMVAKLYLPKSDKPVPLVIVQHGTAQIKNIKSWYNIIIPALVDSGIGVLANDHYTGRKVKKDFAWLNFSTRLADNIEAFNTLVKDSRIDPKKIGFTGYSYGGMEALFLAYKPFQTLLNGSFAAHLPFYPACDAVMQEDMTNAPMKIILAELDDYTPAKFCIDYAKKKNLDILVYEGAHHGFIKKKSLSFHKDAWTWANCSGGYINTDGTWFYENQLWTGTEDEITWAITKKCGTRGVHTGGTKKEVLRAVDDTVAFFKTHLK